MPHKTVFNVMAVWIANASAWVIALSPDDWLNGLQMVKESLAIVSLVIAIGYTLYKFKGDWKGWNPRKRKSE